MDELLKLELLMKLREEGLISAKTMLEAIMVSPETLIDEGYIFDQKKAEIMDNLASKSNKQEKEKNMPKFDPVNNALICDDVHEFAYTVMVKAMEDDTLDIHCKDSLIPGFFGFIFTKKTMKLAVLLDCTKIEDAPGTIATSSSRLRLCAFLRYAIEKAIDPSKKTVKKEEPEDIWTVGGKMVPSGVKPLNIVSVEEAKNDQSNIEEESKNKETVIIEKIPLTEEEKLEKLNSLSNSMILLD